MTKETIKQIILTADDGKYLTNGETYGKTVVLPETANASEWYEITDAEYEARQEAVT
jgi:CMP-N-acetylneuraminic acid synthetase